jgi:hypothetical protein
VGWFISMRKAIPENFSFKSYVVHEIWPFEISDFSKNKNFSSKNMFCSYFEALYFKN